MGQKNLGFGAKIESRAEKNIGETLKNILPEDLLKSGLISEFIGRLPIVVTLEALDEDALVKIPQRYLPHSNAETSRLLISPCMWAPVPSSLYAYTKLTEYTRYLTIGLGVLQSSAIVATS